MLYGAFALAKLAASDESIRTSLLKANVSLIRRALCVRHIFWCFIGVDVAKSLCDVPFSMSVDCNKNTAEDCRGYSFDFKLLIQTAQPVDRAKCG